MVAVTPRGRTKQGTTSVLMLMGSGQAAEVEGEEAVVATRKGTMAQEGRRSLVLEDSSNRGHISSVETGAILNHRTLWQASVAVAMCIQRGMTLRQEIHRCKVKASTHLGEAHGEGVGQQAAQVTGIRRGGGVHNSKPQGEARGGTAGRIMMVCNRTWTDTQPQETQERV